MDSNDHRRRQSHPSGYASQQGLLQTSPQYPATSVPDRFRQAQLGIQSPTAAPSAARGGSLQGYNYAYGEGSQFSQPALAPSSMQYQSEYSHEPQRQSQPYGQYGSGLMYNVPGQQAAPSQSPYEAVQPYQQPRQSTAIEVLSNQFGVPQTYYEGAQASTPSSTIGAQSVPAQYSQMSYTAQQPAAREAIASSTYGMADSTQTAQTGYGQSSYSSSELDTAFGQYQNELKRTFESIREGRLAEAGNALVQISEWLLGNAETLGLVRDDEEMHAERIKLWEQFNTAWLSALQSQRETTISMLDTGQRPQSPRTLMDVEQMENMGKELVRLCDSMEKHGLVDYQMGVWEEDIITLLTACLDLLEERRR